jgi:hypothetical protein
MAIASAYSDIDANSAEDTSKKLSTPPCMEYTTNPKCSSTLVA